jgi:bacterioferritin
MAASWPDHVSAAEFTAGLVRRPTTTEERSDTMSEPTVTRVQLIDRLNEDLAREYQAIIAYVVYSQALKGAQYMSIAKELETHAGEELQHALKVAKHIGYLGGMPTATPLKVVLSEDAEKMLRADLENENNTIRAYRERVRQCEALGEYAIAEDVREILRQEQEHQIDLATALGEDAPNVSKP